MQHCIRPWLWGLICTASLPSAWAAQSEPVAPPPTLNVSGNGQIDIQPDRVRLSISVETTASTADAAAAANARIQQAVRAALQAQGVLSSEISHERYEVSASWRYAENMPPRRVGYTATHSVLIDSAQLDHIGAYIDAALSAGATRVEDPDYYSTTEADARQRALAQAVVNARRDAGTLAQAAGGSVGRLLSLGTQARSSFGGNSELQEVVLSNARRAKAPTAMDPGMLQISASAYAAWEFLPGR